MGLLLMLLLVVVGLSFHAAICIEAYTPYAVHVHAASPCLQLVLQMFISSVASCTNKEVSLNTKLPWAANVNPHKPKIMVQQRADMIQLRSMITILLLHRWELT